MMISESTSAIFDITHLGGETSLKELRQVIGGGRVKDPATIEAAIDVLIWTGCIGVRSQKGITYISDCGFKRPFMRAMLRDEEARSVVFHPTLASIIGGVPTPVEA